MKPVFATDLTENKHNTEPNGREFLTQEPSDALSRRHEEMLGRMNETMEKSQLAKPLRVVEYVCSMGVADHAVRYPEGGAEGGPSHGAAASGVPQRAGGVLGVWRVPARLGGTARSRPQKE